MNEGQSDSLEYVARYFEDVFPGAFVNIENVPMPEPKLDKLADAGFGAAEVIFPDGEEVIATFIINEGTLIAQAVSAIYDAEQNGALPEGSHDRSIDDVAEGTFMSKWKEFVPRHQG
jgi:hypothetical protein